MRRIAKVPYTWYDNSFGKVKVYDKAVETEAINSIDWESKTTRTFYPKLSASEKETILECKTNDYDTKRALDLIYGFAAGKLVQSDYFFRLLLETQVLTAGHFINWHQNKYYPTATVDNLKELGWKKFYELNKDNLNKKHKYFDAQNKTV